MLILPQSRFHASSLISSLTQFELETLFAVTLGYNYFSQTIETQRGKAPFDSTSLSVVSQSNNVISINNTLCDMFQKAINLAYPEVADPPVIVTTSSNAKFGDYQCNSAMPLAQQLSSSGKDFNCSLQYFPDILHYRI